jgi:hypothetical protein
MSEQTRDDPWATVWAIIREQVGKCAEAEAVTDAVDAARQQVEAQHAAERAVLDADFVSISQRCDQLEGVIATLRAQLAEREQPCVWKEERVEYGNNHARDEVKTSCGMSEDADNMYPLMEWPYCPQCGKRLEITRLKGA